MKIRELPGLSISPKIRVGTEPVGIWRLIKRGNWSCAHCARDTDDFLRDDFMDFDKGRWYICYIQMCMLERQLSFLKNPQQRQKLTTNDHWRLKLKSSGRRGRQPWNMQRPSCGASPVHSKHLRMHRTFSNSPYVWASMEQ